MCSYLFMLRDGIIAGIGLTGPPSKQQIPPQDIPTLLQKLEIQTISNNVCKREYEDLQPIQICALSKSMNKYVLSASLMTT